jgi:hypothetical protein
MTSLCYRLAPNIHTIRADVTSMPAQESTSERTVAPNRFYAMSAENNLERAVPTATRTPRAELTFTSCTRPARHPQ